MTQLLLLSGSQRQASFNTRLLHHLTPYLEAGASVVLAQSCAQDLPMFNQDTEHEPTVKSQVAAWHRMLMGCDGVVVASPEYNGQLTAYLKNIVDWVSRLVYIDPAFQNPFLDKPILLTSASTGGSGGSVGLPSARALFGYVGGVVFGESICVPYAHQAWTDMGYFFEPEFEDCLQNVCQRFVALTQAQVKAKSSTFSEKL